MKYMKVKFVVKFTKVKVMMMRFAKVKAIIKFAKFKVILKFTKVKATRTNIIKDQGHQRSMFKWMYNDKGKISINTT